MKQSGRVLCAMAGVLILLLAGLVYAWSVLSIPIGRDFPQWSKAQLSFTFTLVMICFCLGCFARGRLADRLRPDLSIMLSAALLLIGFYASSRTQSLAVLYLGFGVLCGFASGFAYNTVLSTVGSRFPERQGLISGILLMGFGLSAFLIGKAYQALTPETTGAWRHSFLILGFVCFTVLLACAPLIRAPKREGESGKRGSENDVNTRDMLRTPSFWLYFVWATLLSAAGLALVSQASGMAIETDGSVPLSTIATAVGLISVFNAIGRVIAGWIFDRHGLTRTVSLVCAAFVLTAGVLALAVKTGRFPLLAAGFILGGIAYGGVTPTNAAFISSSYGQRFYPMNLAMINFNLIAASFGSTLGGALYDKTGSYLSLCLTLALMAILGALLIRPLAASLRRQRERI